MTLFILFNGFLLPRYQVPGYWIWVYYLNPLQWAVSALVVNEFTSPDYSLPCQNVLDKTFIPQCNRFPNESIGHAWLLNAQIRTDTRWIGLSVIVLFAWLVVWNILAYFSISKIQHAKILKTLKTFHAEASTTHLVPYL